MAHPEAVTSLLSESTAAEGSKSTQDDETEIPKDFEPGCPGEAVLLSSYSFENDDDASDSTDLESLHRKGSYIKEIEKDVSKLDLHEDIPEEEVAVESGNRTPEEDDDKDETDVDAPEIEEFQSSTEYVLEEGESQSNDPAWKQQKKHIFVLSEAGKPIYTRHGSEDKLVTLMGVMQALLSFVQQNSDTIRSIHAGDHNFVFLHRVPLILVAVSTTKASVPQLSVHLHYVYNQIVSVLTMTSLCRIFEQRKNYDLRRLLGGSEKFLDHLVDSMDTDPSFLLSAVRCLSLDCSIRDSIGQTIVQQCSRSKVKNVVFAILLAENQLVTFVRMKKYSLHPGDLHIIMNLVSSSESFKSAETWIPICLPKFDARGFLYGHISYLDEDNSICLLLLTIDKDLFFDLQKCRTKIMEKLQKSNHLEDIIKSVKNGGYTVSDVGIPELRHFLYKSRSAAQFTSPRLGAPYVGPNDWNSLYSLYQYLHHRMNRNSRPLKMLYFGGERETMVGWHMQGFELYAAFEPLVTKSDASNAMKRIVHWIKKEENNIFIMNAPSI